MHFRLGCNPKSCKTDGWKLSRIFRRFYNEENKTRRCIISLRVFACMHSSALGRIGYA